MISVPEMFRDIQLMVEKNETISEKEKLGFLLALRGYLRMEKFTHLTVVDRVGLVENISESDIHVQAGLVLLKPKKNDQHERVRVLSKDQQEISTNDLQDLNLMLLNAFHNLPHDSTKIIEPADQIAAEIFQQVFTAINGVILFTPVSERLPRYAVVTPNEISDINLVKKMSDTLALRQKRQ